MVLGMSLSAFTLVHVLISVVGIFSGIVVVFRMLKGRELDSWNLVSSSPQSPQARRAFCFTPKPSGRRTHWRDLADRARRYASGAHGGHLARAWRWIYAVAAVTALYLNVFVGVVRPSTRSACCTNSPRLARSRPLPQRRARCCCCLRCSATSPSGFIQF